MIVMDGQDGWAQGGSGGGSEEDLYLEEKTTDAVLNDGAVMVARRPVEAGIQTAFLVSIL